MGGAGPEVLVVGAGAVGLATAYYLSRGGARVRVVEAAASPSLTSGASLGILTHANGGDDPYSRLYRDGHAAYGPLAAELGKETGIDIGFRTMGGIDLAFDETDERQLDELAAHNRERGCKAVRLDAAEIRRRVPDIAAEVRGGLFFANDHRVDPVDLSRALLKALAGRGVEVACGVEVTGLEEGGPGVAVQTSEGAGTADYVVLAAGAWTGQLAAMLGASVPVRPVRGQHGRFAGGPRLGPILRWDGKYLVAAGPHIVAGATVEDVGFEPHNTEAGIDEMTDFFTRLLDLPPTLTECRVGLRPKPKGGRPLIGPLAGAGRVFVATGHYKNGILLAAVTGQVLARWILDGDPGRDMARFAPER